MKLLEGAFPGAPSYSSCKAKKAEAGQLAQTAVSSSVLSTLHAHSRGRYGSSSRGASATVRGTAWTMTVRCNGVLVTVQKDVLVVPDSVHHKTVTLHAGQRYFAKLGRK